MGTQLSPHFTLEEMTISREGGRLGLDNSLPEPLQDNIKLLANRMENVRSVLGDRPIMVLSGYRSPAVNRAVRGSINSAHMRALACDFICPRFGTPYEVAHELIAKLEYDQIIWEYTWVHIGFDAGMRRQVLTKLPGKKYMVGLVSPKKQEIV